MWNTRVLVSGGRQYKNRNLVYAALERIYNKTIGTMTVIEGGATGADSFAGEWAKSNAHRGVIHICEEADWDKYGNSAGMKRNKAMADLIPDLCLAFKGGKGTLNMIDICRMRNIKVYCIDW